MMSGRTADLMASLFASACLTLLMVASADCARIGHRQVNSQSGGKQETSGKSADDSNQGNADGDEEAQTPLPVTGTYLADYDNARIRCDYTNKSAATFDSICTVVVLQRDGSELKAAAIKDGVTLAWSNPAATMGDPAISGCEATKDSLIFTCNIDNKSSKNVAEIHYELKITDKARGTRAEGSDLIIPFSVGIAVGFVPSIPYQYAGQTSIPAKLNLTTTTTESQRVGFQNFTYPANSTAFLNPNFICSQGDRVFFMHVNFIYMVQNGQVSLYAGSMSDGNLDDTSSRLRLNITPISMACGKNALYVGSQHYCRIYKVVDNGPVEILAGTDCASPEAPDGTPAAKAAIKSPRRLALTAAEEIIFVAGSNEVRKITKDGKLLTIAGSTTAGYSGDGGPAKNALLTKTNAIAIDPAGNIFITDYAHAVVRKISVDGMINTIAGTGTPRFPNNMNDPKALAEPVSLAIDKDGALYIGELYRGIKKLTPDGKLTQFDSAGADLDVSANQLVLDSDANTIATLGKRAPYAALHFGSNGTLYRDDPKGIMKYAPGTSIASDFVGSDTSDHDCSTQLSAQKHRLFEATALTYTPNDSLITADWKSVDANQIVLYEIIKSQGQHLIRGKYGCDDPTLFSAQNLSMADSLQVNSIGSLATSPLGDIYWAGIQTNRILKISPQGLTTVVAGDGTNASTGDGGFAAAASVKSPLGIALGPDGSLYFAESGDLVKNWDQVGARIRKISPLGTITTVVGTGEPGDDGEGGPAIKAKIRAAAVAVDAKNRLFIADYGNNKIKMVGTDGLITTIAGGGSSDVTDIQMPATNVAINLPLSIAVTNDGSVYFVTDTNMNQLISDASGRWLISRFWGGMTQGDCGSGRYLQNAAASQTQEVVKNSLSVICQGLPQAVTIKDNCPMPGGYTRIAFSQMFNGFANVIEIIHPCAQAGAP